MTSNISSAGKQAPKSEMKKGKGELICPITCQVIPQEHQVTFIYKENGQVRKAVYDKKAIEQWLKRYATCPISNQPIDQLKDSQGKIVWKKGIAGDTAPLTLAILLDTRQRIDRLDRVAPPALDKLNAILSKGSTADKKHLKSLGIAKAADLKNLQEKIDRMAMLVTTASFFKRVEIADQSMQNLVKLLDGIDKHIAEMMKEKTFEGFAKQTLINKQKSAKSIIEQLHKLKSQKGAALEKSFCKIASQMTSPLEIEQICTLAPQVLLYPKS